MFLFVYRYMTRMTYVLKGNKPVGGSIRGFKQLLVAKSFAVYLICFVRRNQPTYSTLSWVSQEAHDESFCWLKETKCCCVAQYLTMW